MIEVLALASAVSSIAGGISSAIQAGKDVNSVMPAFGKLANLITRLYGPPGMWDQVVFEQAAARKRRKDALEAEAEKRDRIFYIMTVAVAVIVFGIGTGGMLWFAAILAEEYK